MIDKKTIGLTDHGQEVSGRLMATGFFKDEVAIARFAMAIALAKGLPGDSKVNAKTVWNVGSFDPSREIANLIPTFLPTVDNPYRYAEVLIELGFNVLENHLREEGALNLNSLVSEESKTE